MRFTWFLDSARPGETDAPLKPTSFLIFFVAMIVLGFFVSAGFLPELKEAPNSPSPVASQVLRSQVASYFYQEIVHNSSRSALASLLNVTPEDSPAAFDAWVFVATMVVAFILSQWLKGRDSLLVMMGGFAAVFVYVTGAFAFGIYLFLLATFYIFLHRESRSIPWVMGLMTILSLFLLVCEAPAHRSYLTLFLLVIGVLTTLFYQIPIARGRSLRLICPLIFSFGLLVGLARAHWDGKFSPGFMVGGIIFVNMTIRLLFAYVDARDRAVPADLSFFEFLLNFMIAPDFFACGWWQHPGEGLAYLKSVYKKITHDELIISGAASMARGIFLMFIVNPFLHWAMTALLPVVGLGCVEQECVMHLYSQKLPLSFGQLMYTGFYYFSFYSLVMLGILHIKVGFYRFFGFNIRSYSNWPIVATRLPDFFYRYGYHFMQLMMRGFYLPAFLKLRGLPLRARAATAVIYTVMFGQFLSYSVHLLYGPGMDTIFWFVLLLCVGILVSFAAGGKASTRKPWSPDIYIATDILKVILIMSFMSFVHLFLVGDFASDQHNIWTLVWYSLTGNA